MVPLHNEKIVILSKNTDICNRFCAHCNQILWFVVSFCCQKRKKEKKGETDMWFFYIAKVLHMNKNKKDDISFVRWISHLKGP